MEMCCRVEYLMFLSTPFTSVVHTILLHSHLTNSLVIFASSYMIYIYIYIYIQKMKISFWYTVYVQYCYDNWILLVNNNLSIDKSRCASFEDHPYQDYHVGTEYRWILSSHVHSEYEVAGEAPSPISTKANPSITPQLVIYSDQRKHSHKRNLI